ncbi:TonB-dependent receptor [Pseudomaricurvus sp. HS19]|uniref:TonB-dependent receptor n=1 Tax=Pseudomaricurvus sp. HS19 TaxID=2692626 RepID=UPI00136F4B53|nr:TonB-dependent receptor [Pseudomaricurvus sp. HS19]MYM64044.1 TonB-dependent receptor [Pseudomaricurvus sp. HS19]
MRKIVSQSPEWLTRTANASLPMASLAIAIASASYLPAASAQEVRSLEEVVVTARRREENLQEVPVAVTAMGEDFLRTQNVSEITDLGTKVPSLRISMAGSSANEPLVSLRGQRPAETAFNQDPAVPMYFNEVVMSPNQGANLGMYDLQGVQVLKGPQGTLFGRNSTGGAILMTPKRPGDEFGGYVEVEAGSYDLIGTKAAVDLPLSEAFSMRIAAHKKDREGYQENTADNQLHGKDFGDEHSQGVRVSLNYEGDALSNLLVVSQDENDITPMVINMKAARGTAAGLNPGFADAVQDSVKQNDPWKVQTDVNAEEYIKNTFASNTTEFELSDNLSVKNVFGYRKLGFETATDADGTAVCFGGIPCVIGGVVTDPLHTSVNSEFYSNELQLLGTAFDESLEWITGVYWSEMDATHNYNVQQLSAVTPFGTFPRYDTGISDAVNTSYGLFFEGTYTFTDEWSLTAGVRQSWDKRELTLQKWDDLDRTNCTLTTPDGSAAAPDCTRANDESYSSPTWRISANYTPEDGVLMYASVSTGYRAGGFNTRAGQVPGDFEPFDEETVTTYELGHKADWEFDWASVRTSAALYHQAYEDIHHTVAYDAGGTPATRTENAAKAAITGFELDVTVVPTDSLTLNVAYSYVDAGFDEREDPIGGNLVDTSNNDFVYIPENSLTTSATYTLPVDFSLGEMSVMVSAYWQDTMNSMSRYEQADLYAVDAADLKVIQDSAEIDDYTVWNLRYDWRNVMGSEVDFAAYVNNLTDEEYVLGGLNVIDAFGYAGYFYGAPRTVGASVRYSF